MITRCTSKWKWKWSSEHWNTGLLKTFRSEYIKIHVLIKELSNLVAGGCNVQAGDGDLSMKKYKIMINRHHLTVSHI